jgi:UPF0176 protein
MLDSTAIDSVESLNSYFISALYKFAVVSEQRVPELREYLEKTCDELKILGLLLVSKEGINGTIAGSFDSVNKFKELVQKIPEYGIIQFKDSKSDFAPFKRLKIVIRDEIVTLDRPDIIPTQSVNHHLSPKEWHEQLSKNDDYVLIDTRNTYEVEIGKFKGAIDPETIQFTEFPKFVKKQNYPKDKKILMYCTGGIRCEKALVYMQQEGYENVYQLDGGILNYLQEYGSEGHWEGDCFIFDHRVALNGNLEPSKTYSLCPHCGNPGKEEIKCTKCNSRAIICHRCAVEPSKNTCSKNCEHHFIRASKSKKKQSQPPRLLKTI